MQKCPRPPGETDSHANAAALARNDRTGQHAEIKFRSGPAYDKVLLFYDKGEVRIHAG